MVVAKFLTCFDLDKSPCFGMETIYGERIVDCAQVDSVSEKSGVRGLRGAMRGAIEEALWQVLRDVLRGPAFLQNKIQRLVSA